MCDVWAGWHKSCNGVIVQCMHVFIMYGTFLFNLCVMKLVCVSHTVTLSDVLNSFLNCHLDSIVSAGGSINSTDIFELALAFALA